MSRSVGIVGAGKLGIALARTALAAGFDVIITSRDVGNTRLIAEVMAPGTRVGTLSEVVAHADLIVLAVPLHRYRDLPPDTFDGKVVVDAINYWEPVDGSMDRFGVAMAETSLLVQSRFTGARVVKGLNQLGYHDVEEGPRPPGDPGRLGIAVSSDDAQAKALVMVFVDELGFDPVDAGPLAEGARLGPGGVAFGATLTASRLRQMLAL